MDSFGPIPLNVTTNFQCSSICEQFARDMIYHGMNKNKRFHLEELREYSIKNRIRMKDGSDANCNIKWFYQWPNEECCSFHGQLMIDLINKVGDIVYLDFSILKSFWNPRNIMCHYINNENKDPFQHVISTWGGKDHSHIKNFTVKDLSYENLIPSMLDNFDEHGLDGFNAISVQMVECLWHSFFDMCKDYFPLMEKYSTLIATEQ